MADLEIASADHVLKAINKATLLLVREGLVDDQVVATKRILSKDIVVGPANQITAAVLTKSKYPSLYASQLEARCFNVRLLDGALVQMSYTFQGKALKKHRLAYLPSPDFEPFQNDPDLFLGEFLFSEIVGDQASPVPLRFDYDLGASRPNHPASHLTVGQYRHCRIPLTGPMGPTHFLRFLIEHFYTHPDHASFASGLTPVGPSPMCITPQELSGFHISIP